MLKFVTFCFLTCFFTSQIRAQQTSLTFTVFTPEKICDTSTKSIKIKQKDSVFYQKGSAACEFDFPLSLPNGRYQLEIISSDFELKMIDFEWKSTLLDLGKIILGESSEIEEVTITGVPKKFIIVDPEKTTITVEGNAVLEKSSIYDAILRIPGILPFPGGGFVYGGQALSIQFDGIASTISGQDLDNLLRSLPANSVTKFDLISNPGASYDASFSGAILDIISQGRTNKWMNGTVTLNNGYSGNWKVTPSFVLNGRTKKVNWQVQASFNSTAYSNNSENTRNYVLFDTITRLYSENNSKSVDRSVNFRPSFTYRFNKRSFIQMNMGLGFGNGQSTMKNESWASDLSIDSLNTQFDRASRNFYVDNTIKYRLLLDTNMRKLEVTANHFYSQNNTFRLTEQNSSVNSWSSVYNIREPQRIILRADLEWPVKKWKAQFNFGSKFTQANTKTIGSYRMNSLMELALKNDGFDSQLPFEFVEENLAFYSEYKQRIGKNFAFTAGLRGENYKLNAEVFDTNYLSQQYFNLFPTLHTMYSFTNDIRFKASFSRRIAIPHPMQFDPNLSGYFDQYTSSVGSSQLLPNFSYRGNAELTIFDYLEVSATYSLSKTVNMSQIFADSNSYFIEQTQSPYNNVSTWSFFYSLPIPFGMFTEGFKYFQKEVDVNKISYMYVYAGNDRTFIPGMNTEAQDLSTWNWGAYSQIVLPLETILNIEYNWDTRGFYLLNERTKDVHALDLTLSKNFKKDTWRLSFSIDDVLNSRAYYSRQSFAPIVIDSYSKDDTRVFWFKISHSFGKIERPSLEGANGLSRGGGE